MNCKHCEYRKARPKGIKGLCWTCSLDPAIRVMYPSGSKYARRGPGCRLSNAIRIPAAPTDAEPFSPEMFEVMAGRASRGETLWHPKDGMQ